MPTNADNVRSHQCELGTAGIWTVRAEKPENHEVRVNEQPVLRVLWPRASQTTPLPLSELLNRVTPHGADPVR